VRAAAVGGRDSTARSGRRAPHHHRPLVRRAGRRARARPRQRPPPPASPQNCRYAGCTYQTTQQAAPTAQTPSTATSDPAGGGRQATGADGATVTVTPAVNLQSGGSATQSVYSDAPTPVSPATRTASSATLTAGSTGGSQPHDNMQARRGRGRGVGQAPGSWGGLAARGRASPCPAPAPAPTPGPTPTPNPPLPTPNPNPPPDTPYPRSCARPCARPQPYLVVNYIIS
jgi:hypothetical protein